MNTAFILLMLSVSAALLALVTKRGSWGQRTPSEPPPEDPDGDLERDVSALSVKQGVPPSVKRAQRAHHAELLPLVERSVAPMRLHREFNKERGMYQVWAGAKRFDDAPAHLRAEKATETGALRCMLNANGAPRGNFWLVEPPERPKSVRRSKPRLAAVSTPPEGRIRVAS